MPARRTLGSGALVRPLIGLGRAALASVVAAAGIDPVVDPANVDPAHARSLVRHQLLPLAETHWPGATLRLRQLARAQSERDAALALLLQPLLRRGVDDDGGLRLAVLRGQPLPVARALLSAWLMPHVGPVPSRHLGELLRQLLTAPHTGHLEGTLRGHALRCHRDTAYLLARARPVPAARAGIDPAAAEPEAAWLWDGRAPLNLAVGALVVGRLHRLPAIQGMRWPEHGVLVRLRAGGERLQLHADGPRREVKALLREAGVPVWQRARWPLVYLPAAPPGTDAGQGGTRGEAHALLLAVPAVGVAHGWRADPGTPGFTLAFDPVRATV
jgi:tRNA(Ile)-lysidine synthase